MCISLYSVSAQSGASLFLPCSHKNANAHMLQVCRPGKHDFRPPPTLCFGLFCADFPSFFGAIFPIIIFPRPKSICTEQMDAEGLGRKLLLTPHTSLATRKPLKSKSRLWVVQQHLTECAPCKHFRALSMSPKTAASIYTL